MIIDSLAFRAFAPFECLPVVLDKGYRASYSELCMSSGQWDETVALAMSAAECVSEFGKSACDALKAP